MQRNFLIHIVCAHLLECMFLKAITAGHKGQQKT